MKQRHTTKATGSRTTGHSMRSPMENAREEIIDWLRDAYAMERGLEQALEKHANNEDLSPTARTRASTHLEETRRHAEAVRAALQSLNTDTSSLKTGAGLISQLTKGMATKFSRDERIKDLLDAYAMEHFEIACYEALAAAATKADLPAVADTCRRIIPDEERMAQTIRDSLPSEIAMYLYEVEAPA